MLNVVYPLAVSILCWTLSYAFSFDGSAGSKKRERAACTEDCNDDEQWFEVRIAYEDVCVSLETVAVQDRARRYGFLRLLLYFLSSVLCSMAYPLVCGWAWEVAAAHTIALVCMCCNRCEHWSSEVWTLFQHDNARLNKVTTDYLHLKTCATVLNESLAFGLSGLAFRTNDVVGMQHIRSRTVTL